MTIAVAYKAATGLRAGLARDWYQSRDQLEEVPGECEKTSQAIPNPSDQAPRRYSLDSAFTGYHLGLVDNAVVRLLRD